MKNSHYVPRFILKNFSEKICTYNIKTGVLNESIKLERAFAEQGFYSDAIEDKLNYNIESSFSKLLKSTILDSDSVIELTRRELRLIRLKRKETQSKSTLPLKATSFAAAT